MYQAYYQEQVRKSYQMNNAYVAGLIDGEGCIYLAVKQGKKKYYSARVDVGMTHKALSILEGLQNMYQGRLRLFRPQTEKWEAAYSWSVFGQEAVAFLRMIHPFLILKKEQASIVLRIYDLLATAERNHNGTPKWTPVIRRQAEAARVYIQALNRKGPSDKTLVQDGWFVRLVGGLWTTPQHDMFTSLGLQEYSETWPKAGTMQNGTVYRQPPLAPRISGTGSLLLPTPATVDSGAYSNRSDSPNATLRPTLGAMAKYKLWPTPKAGDADFAFPRTSGRPVEKVTHLATAVKYWPTPTSSDSHGAGKHGEGGLDLRTAVGGRLNPNFVEFLMGFPQDWSKIESADLEGLEMQSFPPLLSGSENES